MQLPSVICGLAIACLLGPTSALSTCQDRILSITVDNNLELYIDGVQQTNLPNANNWRKADNVNLSCRASLIAVKGTDDGMVNSGILASTADGYVLTNSSWKCTRVYSVGWQGVGFDDSSWPSAYSIAPHNTSPWSLVSGIRTDAYWIWTRNHIRGDKVVYCRKRLAPPPCPSRKFKVTVDNAMRLYVDGIEKTGLPNADNWMMADSIDLPGNARVIAIQGTDYHVRAGILASTDDGYIITNASWKCTRLFESGWQQIGFDDSSWPAAYVIAIHNTSPWTTVSGIRQDAYWIWTRNFISGSSGDSVVYCRKTLVVPRSCKPRLGIFA